MPYLDPGEVEFFLNDYDKIEEDNVETSLLLSEDDIGEYKTRACAAWLKKRGFETRLVERPFDSSFRRRDDEPGVALCGFDSNLARRDLAGAQFLRIVESGLGGTANNFDTISLHTIPNPRAAAELWPDLPPDKDARRREHQERMARENNAYLHINLDECGRFQLAGKSIAVPFVGATAAAPCGGRNNSAVPLRSGLYRHKIGARRARHARCADLWQLQRSRYGRIKVFHDQSHVRLIRSVLVEVLPKPGSQFPLPLLRGASDLLGMNP